MSEIEQRYGVPAEILTAIWGLETAYGQIMGNQDVIRSLATLAAQGRRRAWAETQLMSAAQMISDGYANRTQLRGSWAGAMGHTQFIPETYLSRAVDGDGDGRRDIWNSPADALASAANLLRNAGWRPGGSWAVEVTVPRTASTTRSPRPWPRPRPSGGGEACGAPTAGRGRTWTRTATRG
jgi:lytic murein transglycosylase